MLERSPNLSPNRIADTLYNEWKDSLLVEARQRVAFNLIEKFDAFCREHNAEYFAIAGTLEGAIAYGGFIPGNNKLEVGMLRKEFLKLKKAYEEATNPSGNEEVAQKNSKAATISDNTKDEENPEDTEDSGILYRMTCTERTDNYRVYEPADSNGLGFELITTVDDDDQMMRLQPLVIAEESQMICVNGELVYGKKQLPLRVQAQISISVFDAIPKDYDFARFHFQRLKQLKNLRASFAKSNKPAQRLIAKRLWKLADKYNDQPHDEVCRLVPSRSRSILLEELLPIKRVPFGPTEICAPQDTTTWVVEDTDAQAKQVSYLQNDALRIMAEIDRICRANDIGYFICGGTMLGKVRHGGFIPWDDDMDVGMLRADYERFLEVAAKELDTSTFFLQTRQTDPNIPYLFSKVRLLNSEYITKYNEFRDFNKGICIDVFPFDKAPYEYGLMGSHLAKVRKLIRAHNKIANRQVGDMPKESATSPTEAIARGIMTARHSVYWHQSLAKTQQDYHDFVMQYNDCDDLNFVASYVATFTMVELDDLLPYQDVEYEGLTLSMAKNPEVFLQMQYGDFMTEPLPHQQRGHGLLWWSDEEHNAGEFGKKRFDAEPAGAAIPIEPEPVPKKRKKTKYPVRKIGVGVGVGSVIGAIAIGRKLFK